MSTGERFRGVGARSITRFLAEHQACDGGFEVGREPDGPGRIKVTCKGCGAVGGYAAAEAASALDLEDTGDTARKNRYSRRNAQVAAPPSRTPDAPAPPRPAAGGPAPPPPPSAPSRPPWRGGRPWLAPALIGGALLVGGGLIAVGIFAGDDGEDAAPPPAPVAETEPPAAPAPQPPPGKDVARLREKVRLQGQVFSDRFSVGVPLNWDSGTIEGGGTALFSPDGRAFVRIYYEVGGADIDDLASAAGRFLEGEHRGARVSAPATKRIGSLRGRAVTAVYPGGRERAVVLSSDGVSYLLTEAAEDEASQFRRLQAKAALQSFRPL
jgi:hypothetical protein